ncbi:AraC family transcriptional regulator [Actinoallomurus iriomotensis]|uniref:AraC family transcriptional regulator n=1 Tax=Actinoallomurus iriomotensis TaxID=478107 RepID=A0A9W6VQ49_9ACTN|nr:AraC family transcriptional regulator [Actinoallomurus iriomotensis]GLY74241.1 AraC family transcriptional regulator [Actinoallomurus iriomotensis]
MDPLARLLDGPRARDAFLLRSILTPPWSLRIEDRAPLTVASVVRGEAWLVPDDDAAVRLGPGDVAVIRGPHPYTVADDPATPPRVVIHPGQRCATPEGESLSAAMALGLRTWGDRTDDAAGATELFTGVYEFEGEINGRLSRVLPQRLVLPADAWDSPLLPLLGEELHRDAPGQQALLDRLLDLLLTAVLRAWFSRPEAEVPGWYRAQGDPVVGAALRLLHGEPAHPWTVAALAARTGVSRAALARRFSDLVGEPPMTYLTDLRLALAADLLREPDATVAAVARQVGYGSAFALSAAFKRERGISPQEHRAAAFG